MFSFFRRSRQSNDALTSSPATESAAQELREWARGRRGVEGYIEPKTLVNELSLLLVDAVGNPFRRSLGSAAEIRRVARDLAIPLFYVEDTGYPPRMRARLEYDRRMRKRAEQAERRRARRADPPDAGPAQA